MLTVETNIKLPGFHCYPDAPDEVSFLRSMHRHLFTISAEVEVDYSNREVEFFLLQRSLIQVCTEHPILMQIFVGSGFSASCEEMASHIATTLTGLQYRPIHTQVSEDGESTGHWYV